jgi:hypothetical protein
MVASNDFVEYVLATFDSAAEANRRTPGRQGNLVELAPELADEVMVTGDLHGHRQNFNLIRRLAALDEHPRRHLVLQEVCHGGPTYPNGGGCMSHTILEDSALLKTQYPERVHLVLGNHELAELTDYPIQKSRQLLNAQFRLGLQQMYGDAAGAVHDAYRRFLRTCPLAVRLPQGVFISHSIPPNVGLRPFDPSLFSRQLTADDFCELSDLFRFVWGRDYRNSNVSAFAEMVGAKVFINGHEPCYEGFVAPNDFQVILDCSSQQAAYLILPVGKELSHGEIMERVKRLEEDAERGTGMPHIT